MFTLLRRWLSALASLDDPGTRCPVCKCRPGDQHGQTYIIGEVGPELHIPTSEGKIVPRG